MEPEEAERVETVEGFARCHVHAAVARRAHLRHLRLRRIAVSEGRHGERVSESLEQFEGRKAFVATALLIDRDDRTCIWTAQGNVVLAKLTPRKYEELGRSHLLEPSQV